MKRKLVFGVSVLLLVLGGLVPASADDDTQSESERGRTDTARRTQKNRTNQKPENQTETRRTGSGKIEGL